MGVLLAGGACAGPPGASAHHAELDGIRMYYDVVGRGPTLVLLHGGMGSGRQFANQVRAFAARYRLVIPDMCAQGRTTDRPGPLSYHAMAEDVIALLDRLHVQRFDLMGWSDGGDTGLDIAIRHPDRLRHLVTLGANFSPDGPNAPDVAWIDTATAAAFGDGARDEWRRLSPQPDHFDAATNKIIAMWRTQPNFTLRELRSIRAKTLVCAGEHDLIRQEHTEELARAIPGAELWIVPGATHGLMLEKPRLVNARVLEFLSR